MRRTASTDARSTLPRCRCCAIRKKRRIACTTSCCVCGGAAATTAWNADRSAPFWPCACATKRFRVRAKRVIANGSSKPCCPSATSPISARWLPTASRFEARSRSLGEKHRETIGLAYYGQLTLDEISRKLDEPLGTIKSRLSTALRKLRETLASEELPNA